MRSDRVHRALLFFCAISAAACVAELFWLRSTQLTVTRPIVAALFLPWLAAAAANLSVWYSTLKRSAPTALNKIGMVLFWIVAGAFALAFLGLYAALLLGVL